jgi:hypothetical protein
MNIKKLVRPAIVGSLFTVAMLSLPGARAFAKPAGGPAPQSTLCASYLPSGEIVFHLPGERVQGMDGNWYICADDGNWYRLKGAVESAPQPDPTTAGSSSVKTLAAAA